jgi:hypothetical protein
MEEVWQNLYGRTQSYQVVPSIDEGEKLVEKNEKTLGGRLGCIVLTVWTIILLAATLIQLRQVPKPPMHVYCL